MAPSEIRLNEVSDGFLNPVKPKAGIILRCPRDCQTTSSLHDGFYFLPNLSYHRLFFGAGVCRRDRIITRAGGEIYSMALFTNLFGATRSCVAAIVTLW